MTLADLAAIGGLISSLAVLVSLALVLRQMRQTDRNQRALIIQGAMARDTAIVGMLQQPDFASAWARAVAGETTPSAIDTVHMASVLRGLIGSLQETLLQKREGLIDQVTVDYVELGVHTFLAQPTMRAVWTVVQSAYPRETIDLVDSIIAKVPLAAPADLAMVMKGLLHPGAVE
jgi:hypothetical protein